MKRSDALKALACIVPACLVWQSCNNDALGPPGLYLLAGVQSDSAAFRSGGQFVLHLVPVDHAGQALASDSWNIRAALTRPIGDLSYDTAFLQPADPRPPVTAILIDNSGSMLENDPDRHRARAAQQFWHAILGGDAGGQVALLDFGRGSTDTPSPGFTRTRLLQTFTPSIDQLDAQLDSLRAVGGGGTPLFRAAREVIQWMDSTVPGQTTVRRSLVVVTDGEPDDTLYRDALYSNALAMGVVVHAVGVGAAADGNGANSAAALLRELATRTGGYYASAEPASRLLPALAALAVQSTEPRLVVVGRVQPVPAQGTLVEGTVTLEGKEGTVTTRWSFTAP